MKKLALKTLTAVYAFTYKAADLKADLRITAQKQGRRLSIIIEDTADDRYPEQERPYLAYVGAGRVLPRLAYAPGIRIGQFADIARQNDTLEAMSVSKNFRLWFRVHCLTTITADLTK